MVVAVDLLQIGKLAERKEDENLQLSPVA